MGVMPFHQWVDDEDYDDGTQQWLVDVCDWLEVQPVHGQWYWGRYLWGPDDRVQWRGPNGPIGGGPCATREEAQALAVASLSDRERRKVLT